MDRKPKREIFSNCHNAFLFVKIKNAYSNMIRKNEILTDIR